MKNRIIVLLTAWLICCAVQPFSAATAEETRMDTYVLDQHGTVYAYLPQILKDGESYPLAELILVENAGHVQHSCNARYAWDFFKHFARTEDGRIIELAE
jgi:hypothetical protein